MTPHECLRAALQAVLDSEDGDGWLLNHYVVVMGVQKMDSNGKVNSACWMTYPEDQANYITTGLLDSAQSLQAAVTEIGGEED